MRAATLDGGTSSPSSKTPKRGSKLRSAARCASRSGGSASKRIAAAAIGSGAHLRVRVRVRVRVTVTVRVTVRVRVRVRELGCQG